MRLRCFCVMGLQICSIWINCGVQSLPKCGCWNSWQVKEKRAELEKLKITFVRRASEFLRNYFASLVDFMISDKSYFSQVFPHLHVVLFLISILTFGPRNSNFCWTVCIKQRGQLKRPDHADLRYKCRTYARLLQHLKVLLSMNFTIQSDDSPTYTFS